MTVRSRTSGRNPTLSGRALSVVRPGGPLRSFERADLMDMSSFFNARGAPPPLALRLDSLRSLAAAAGAFRFRFTT
jgi:hypothetical protein